MADTKELSPSRQLILHLMLSVLVSAAVFVVVAWLVLVPQMARQEAQIRSLQSQVDELTAVLDDAQAEAEEEPEVAPQAPTGAPATAPAGTVPAAATAEAPKK